MKSRTPPPRQKEIALLAGLTPEQIRRHTKGVQTSVGAMLATQKLCSECANDSIDDIMTIITQEVDDAIIKAVCSIHAPADDRQYRTKTECYLLFLHHCGNMGLDVRGISFRTSNRLGWHLEVTIDDMLVQVVSLDRYEAIMYFSHLPFKGNVEFLSQVLTALNRGTKEELL